MKCGGKINCGICLYFHDDEDDARTIVSVTSRDVKNPGLFVNNAISSNITLKIGTEVVTGNYKYIISNDIT